MEVNRKIAKLWSKMGPRAVYGKVMADLALFNEDVLLVSADLGRSSGLASFYQAHPERFVNAGIAEQNMVGIAAGLTRINYKVYASTFAPFASMRAAEQVRMNMGYMHEPVKLVALGSGLAMGFLGNSHFGLEDLAVMRAIPDLTIISPADCIELYKVLHATLQYDHPVYIRLTGATNCPVVYEEDYQFEIGKPNWILPKGDINVFACGSIVGQAKKAIEKLNDEKGLSIGLLNFHTLKPIDKDWLAEQVSGTETLFIFEEHTAVGGLRSLLFDFLIEYNLRLDIIAHTLPDAYLETGEYDYLLATYGLDSVGIEVRMREKL